MPYIPFTDEQKRRANAVDLAAFLRHRGETLIPSGRDKRLAGDHSITICGSAWFDHATGKGGHAISFVQYYTDDTSVYEAAKTIYREYDLGWGEEKSGVLLLLSMAERDYSLIAYGYGNTAFTDYGKDVLADEFLDDFGDDDWYGGFSDYLEQSGDMLKLAKMGKPLDVTSNPLIRFAGIAISILSGVIVSLLICCTLEQKMKSVSIKSGANAYIPAGSVDITLREDRFTHTTERREKIEKSSGGRGGTTIDRDGFSGKSGKF